MSFLGYRLPMTLRLERRRRVTDAGCWEWLGRLDPGRYGVIYVTAEGTIRAHPRRVHRVAYETYVGPIPAGLVIDHLCRNRSCFNPDHLEPVTLQENVNRGTASPVKTHCINEHEFTPENTYRRGNRRHCRACNRDAARRYAERSAA